MIPMGLRTFGHSDYHDNHDSMTYEQALASFSRCFQTMTDFGLKPISYAYPGGWCYEEETRRALKASGFLNGRKFGRGDYINPYIVPDTVSEPSDWFYLPTLVMENYDFAQCKECVGLPEELAEYLDETMQRKAWIITTYHTIYDWDEPQGQYKLSDFERDLQEVQKRDMWATSMDEATLYVLERKQASVHAVHHIHATTGDVYSLSINLGDNLPNERFVQPLTILLDAPQPWIGKTVGIYNNNKLQQTFLLQSGQMKVSLQPFETTYTIKLLEF